MQASFSSNFINVFIFSIKTRCIEIDNQYHVANKPLQKELLHIRLLQGLRRSFAAGGRNGTNTNIHQTTPWSWSRGLGSFLCFVYDFIRFLFFYCFTNFFNCSKLSEIIFFLTLFLLCTYFLFHIFPCAHLSYAICFLSSFSFCTKSLTPRYARNALKTVGPPLVTISPRSNQSNVEGLGNSL